MVAPAARLVAYSGFDATLIRRAMTAAAVSVFVSKSGDIREILDAIRADVASTPRLSAEVLTGATAVAMTTECLDPVRGRASAVTTGHKPAARASGQASHDSRAGTWPNSSTARVQEGRDPPRIRKTPS
jgi:DNA-binding NarL/FixJ family response regulator